MSNALAFAAAPTFAAMALLTGLMGGGPGWGTSSCPCCRG